MAAGVRGSAKTQHPTGSSESRNAPSIATVSVPTAGPDRSIRTKVRSGGWIVIQLDVPIDASGRPIFRLAVLVEGLEPRNRRNGRRTVGNLDRSTDHSRRDRSLGGEGEVI